MKKYIKYCFFIEDLSVSALEFLRHGWCVNDDLNHFQISEETLLDFLYNSGEGTDYDSVPEYVWVKLNLTDEVRSCIEAAWRDNAETIIEWVSID